MRGLLEYSGHLLGIYKKYEKFLQPVIKLVVAFVWLFYLSSKIGQNPILSKWFVLVIISGFCMLLPMPWMVSILLLGLVFHLASISYVAGGFALLILVLAYIFYFRLVSEEGWIWIFLPMAVITGVGMIPAIILGFKGRVTSIIGLFCSCIFFYYSLFIVERIGRFTDNYPTQAMNILRGFIGTRQWLVYGIIFSIICVCAYLISRFHMDYSWLIAGGTGLVLGFILLLILPRYFGITIGMPQAIINLLGSSIVLLVYGGFYYRIDYTRTEMVQFEDDEYYYYVKAVPKVKVKTRKKQVDNI